VPAEPSQAEIEEILRLLAGARRPLVVAGRGGIHAKEELIALAERTGALLGTSLLGKDLFRGHRLDLGIVGGWASDAARPLLDELDLVLVFGASLNSFTMAFGNLFKSTPIVQVDIDASHLGANYPVQLGIAGDSRATAKRLLKALPEAPADPELHRPETLERIAQPLYLGDDESSETEADPRVLATILDELLPAQRAIVTDGGHFMGFPGMYMHVPTPDRFRQTSAFASIGLGIGAAIGSAVARPDEQTVFFAGDGGLMMSLGDLETVARYGIPLVIVVMDDRALGAERHFLDLMGVSHQQSVFGDVDFAGVARALGIESETVRSPDDLRALAPRLSQPRSEPLLLDCKIRGDLRARWLEEIE
jgi:thiamine pyrophosphate-dependent acetolactate synthase large subunit-like protein